MILSLYGSHDASATFVDKNNQLRIFEYERFVDIRYAMFSDRFDGRGIGTNKEMRVAFLEYIKTQIKNDPTILLHNELSLTDIDLVRSVFPNINKIEQMGHHKSHAASGFYQSPFKKALIISIDGGGTDEGEVNMTKVYLGDNDKLKELPSPDLDLGNPYSLIGIPISEIKPGKDIIQEGGNSLVYAGKVMGICAYGQVQDSWFDAMLRFYKHQNLTKLGNEIGLDLRPNSLSGQNSYDLAATSQNVFEYILRELFIQYWSKYRTDVVLVGGCALNVLFNQQLKKYLNESGFDLYVPPNPNDCGLSLGQYLLEAPNFIDPVVYGGLDILDREEYDLTQYKEATLERIVELISAGKIGGIIQGYSEVGPRALGNRSIICDPSFPDMKNILNAKVKFREWYRPFAPVCREEDMNIFFDDAYPSVYMSYAPRIKDEYADQLSSIVHEDNTGRLQTVTEKQHPFFYELLTYMKQQGKTPVILNTSFNIRGRPILTTIEDAMHVLHNTELDFLVIEGKLVIK